MLLLERDEVGRGTSYVAAGMLAPVAEAEFGSAGRRLLELGLRSAEMWPGFAAELEASAEMEVGLLRTGTLVLARDEDEARELERQLEFRRSLGLRAERLRASAAREREPGLAPTVRLAIEAPDDHSVDPRLALTALHRACETAGVRIRAHAAVESVELDDRGERAIGLRLRGGERVGARQLVLAAGAWSGQVGGLPDAARVPVRPVKGQILRLRDPAGPGLLTRVVRFEGGYLVPRADGRYALGATVEEKGFELAPTAGGVYELLRDASELVPGIDELQIEELSVGTASGDAGQSARDRARRGGGPGVGDGALPQRHPARSAHRRARARDARRGGGMIVNGERADIPAGETVAAVLNRLGLEADARGVAVAIDGEVLPRACWETFALPRDARVEVLTAMQGG